MTTGWLPEPPPAPGPGVEGLRDQRDNGVLGLLIFFHQPLSLFVPAPGASASPTVLDVDGLDLELEGIAESEAAFPLACVLELKKLKLSPSALKLPLDASSAPPRLCDSGSERGRGEPDGWGT